MYENIVVDSRVCNPGDETTTTGDAAAIVVGNDTFELITRTLKHGYLTIKRRLHAAIVARVGKDLGYREA